jgi:hypothetical protein
LPKLGLSTFEGKLFVFLRLNLEAPGAEHRNRCARLHDDHQIPIETALQRVMRRKISVRHQSCCLTQLPNSSNDAILIFEATQPDSSIFDPLNPLCKRKSRRNLIQINALVDRPKRMVGVMGSVDCISLFPPIPCWRSAARPGAGQPYKASKKPYEI